jgi:hypothetical protein
MQKNADFIETCKIVQPGAVYLRRNRQKVLAILSENPDFNLSTG